jgi:hypothetical protein
MKTLFVFSFLISTQLLALDFVCVRNDLKSGLQLCEVSPDRWAYFYNANPDDRFDVCAEKYAASMCDSAPRNFVWAETTTGAKACVLNNNVDTIDMCEGKPVQFSYIFTEKP